MTSGSVPASAGGGQAEGSVGPDVYVVYDFSCPYSYIVQHEIDRLHAHFEMPPPKWRPYWLHPGVTEARGPFGSRIGGERLVALRAWLAEMSPELGATMEIPDREVSPLRCFAAMEFARDFARDVDLRRAVFRAVWLDGENIAETGVVARLLGEVGLDPDAFFVDEARFRDRALASCLRTQRLGLTTTPTTLLGRTAVVGWHYYEVFEQLLLDQQVPRRSNADVRARGSSPPRRRV